MKGNAEMLYIGCPVWGYKEWVGNFFPTHTPQNAFLRLYSRKFNTVEGNTTFYATPDAETVARWHGETPEGFRFCPKVSRSISHLPGIGLQATQAETLAFTDHLRGLGNRLGPMFLQLPATFSPQQLPALETFLDFWPSDLQLAVEVRHPAFFAEPHEATLNELLRAHNTARVIMDSRPIRLGSSEEKRIMEARERKPDVPVHIALTADFVLLRYIGNPSAAVNAPFLDTWARYLAQWYRQGITPYVFCHCPFTVHSPEICTSLYQKVADLTPIPPIQLPSGKEDTAFTGLEQARMF